MTAPLVVQITQRDVLSEEELFARLGRVAALGSDKSARFVVMLRDPELSGRSLFDLGARLRAATRHIGASFFVNDRLDLALALGADGLHLGRLSVDVDEARALFARRIPVSISCHSVEDVVAAARRGADLALLSPIFASPGKGAPIGVAAIAAAKRALSASGLALDLVALGGVDRSNARECLRAGASGVASIRGDLVSTLECDLAT